MLLGMGEYLTKDQCVAFQCGYDPTNMGARFQCAQNGYAGVKSCNDPDCKPYCQQPAATSANAPVSTVPAPAPTNPPRSRCASAPGADGSPGGTAAGFGLFDDVIAQLQTIPCWAWIAGGLAVAAWKGKF